MIDTVDSRYVQYLVPSLHAKKKGNAWNFRCPICGDSKKDKSKARGYIIKKKGYWFFYCHNCTESLKLADFIEKVNPPLYSQYIVDKMEAKVGVYKPEAVGVNEYSTGYVQPKKIVKDLNLPRLSDLPADHKAVQYFTRRKIPEKFLSYLYYAESFKKFVDEFWPENGKEFPEQEDRLVIPFKDAAGKILGVQGRNFQPDGIRYITIKPDEASVKMFGMDLIDFDKTIYVVEGPIDSMFLDNAVGTMDSALYRATRLLGVDDGQVVDIYDNQPRNTHVIKNMKRSIQMGHSIVIWPEGMEGKDINDLCLEGVDVKKLIEERTFEGIKAELELSKWRR